MQSKSWIAIIVIGVLGFCALGLMTKYALESNPGLARMTKLKLALAEDFSSAGVEQVSLKALPGRRGWEVKVEASRGDLREDPSLFCRRVAQAFVERWAGPPPPVIKISLSEPGRLGCRAPVTFLEQEIDTRGIQEEVALRPTVKAFQESLPQGYRVRPVVSGDPLKVAVEVPEPRNDDELARTLALLRQKLEEHLSAGRGRVVELEVWSSGPKARLLEEERLERSAPRRAAPARRRS